MLHGLDGFGLCRAGRSLVDLRDLSNSKKTSPAKWAGSGRVVGETRSQFPKNGGSSTATPGTQRQRTKFSPSSSTVADLARMEWDGSHRSDWRTLRRQYGVVKITQIGRCRQSEASYRLRAGMIMCVENSLSKWASSPNPPKDNVGHEIGADQCGPVRTGADRGCSLDLGGGLLLTHPRFAFNPEESPGPWCGDMPLWLCTARCSPQRNVRSDVVATLRGTTRRDTTQQCRCHSW